MWVFIRFFIGKRSRIEEVEFKRKGKSPQIGCCTDRCSFKCGLRTAEISPWKNKQASSRPNSGQLLEALRTCRFQLGWIHGCRGLTVRHHLIRGTWASTDFGIWNQSPADTCIYSWAHLNNSLSLHCFSACKSLFSLYLVFVDCYFLRQCPAMLNCLPGVTHVTSWGANC